MYRLLIVEDEAWIRMGLERTVDWTALDVELLPSAANGEEALSRIRARRPDLLLTDIRMPQMDGIELMRRVREEFPEILTLVLSGFGEFAYAQKALEYGAFSYILKPVDDAALSGEIRRCIQTLSQRRLSAEPEAWLAPWLRGLLPARRKLFHGAARVRLGLVSIDWRETIDPALARTLHDMVLRYIGDSLGAMQLARAEMGMETALLLEDTDGEALSRRLQALNITGESAMGFAVALALSAPAALPADGAALWRQAAEALRWLRLSENPGRGAAEAAVSEAARRFDELLGAHSVDEALQTAEALLDDARPFEPTGPCVATAFLLSLCRRMDPETSVRLSQSIAAEFLSLQGVRGAEAMKELLRRCAREWMPGRPPHRPLVVQAMAYIDAHIAEPELSLSSVSAALFANHAYLSYAFKTDAGINLTEHIMNRRIEIARTRIAADSAPLQEIALSVGYPNFQYFLRVFKRQTGITPSQYRKNISKQK